jgi:amidase
MPETVLTRARRARSPRPRPRATCDRPLAGVPVAIKDDTDVAAERTCFGTAVIEGRASEGSDVVARLRRAGAMMIGKTNVPASDSWASPSR